MPVESRDEQAELKHPQGTAGRGGDRKICRLLLLGKRTGKGCPEGGLRGSVRWSKGARGGQCSDSPGVEAHPGCHAAS